MKTGNRCWQKPQGGALVHFVTFAPRNMAQFECKNRVDGEWKQCIQQRKQGQVRR
jgi:hypothetical protein